MSLILDALNRSRQDVDEVPGLATQHYSEPEEPDKRRGYLPWVGLLVALLVIAWLLLDRGPVENGSPEPAVPTTGVTPETTTPPPAAAEGSPGLTTQIPPPVAARAHTEQPAASGPAVPVQSNEPIPTAGKTEQQSNSAVADLYLQSSEPPPVVPRPAAEHSASTSTSAPAPAQALQLVGEAESVQAPEPAGQQAEEQPIDIEKMVLKAREQMENASLEEHPAPFIADLSQQTKDAIPTIFYERHDYSGDSAQSIVVLNGKKLKAGGVAAAGVQVEEVLPDSVVLSHRGTQFRLRALNSWINL